MNTKNISLKNTYIFPLGASYTKDGIRISAVVKDGSEAGVLLYRDNTEEPIRIVFPDWSKTGKICSVEIIGIDNCSKYLLFEDDNIFLDPYMTSSANKGVFGECLPLYSKISEDSYSSIIDKVKIPFEKSVFYMLHVRGFSAHSSSKIKDKGTFKGLMNKIPYIKDLGITSIILMPVYEFNEIIQHVSNDKYTDMKSMVQYETQFNSQNKVNYWGYSDGYYYVPKSSYSSKEDSVSEYHELVDCIHSLGIEVIMQFWFPNEYTARQITDVLRFWVQAYMIDGFQLVGNDLPIKDIVSDPVLHDCKMLFDQTIDIHGDINKNHGHIDYGFLAEMRCFLKGDPNLAGQVVTRLRNADLNRHPVNAIARQDTMRLADIVMYNEKHNLDNGENGRDGANENYSWNCGKEGPTKSKAILSLREKQIKNALCLTILCEGSPLIYSGDEFGNSQYGNNNPYNQDNEIGYIKWSNSTFSKRIYDFTKSLISFKNKHASLQAEHNIFGRDHLSYGFPDVSLHGKELWRSDLGSTSHTFGMLFYDKYFDVNQDGLIYVMYNMHWEKQTIALPEVEAYGGWKLALSTDNIKDTIFEKEIVVPPRSIVILET